MKKLLLLLLLAPLNLGATEIAPFTAHYDIRFSGLGGEAVMTLTRDSSGAYVLENRTSAKGLARLARPRDAVDRSEFVLADNQFRPVSFLSEDGTRRNKRGNTISFDWDAGSVSSIYKDETRTLPLRKGMLDRQLLQLAMMSDLAEGKTEASYTIVDRHSLKVYNISVVAEERIDVPAGSFDVIKLTRERDGSSRSSILWCAPALNYLTVKMEQLKEGKVIGTLLLADVSQGPSLLPSE